MKGRPKGSRDKKPRMVIKGHNTPPWRRGMDKGLRLAIREAGKRSGLQPKYWTTRGKTYLAEGLGITVQSINHWTRVPRERVMMVHMLTGVPLSVLAPDLFKD